MTRLWLLCGDLLRLFAIARVSLLEIDKKANKKGFLKYFRKPFLYLLQLVKISVISVFNPN